MDEKTKECRVCHITKVMAKFNKNKNAKDGHLNICKECDKIQNKEWYQANKEAAQLKRKKWQEDNKELHKEHMRNYRKRKVANVKIEESNS